MVLGYRGNATDAVGLSEMSTLHSESAAGQCTLVYQRRAVLPRVSRVWCRPPQNPPLPPYLHTLYETPTNKQVVRVKAAEKRNKHNTPLIIYFGLKIAGIKHKFMRCLLANE